jgi:hypothetical protein
VSQIPVEAPLLEVSPPPLYQQIASRAQPSVLVGDIAPSPVGQRPIGDDPEGLERIDALLDDCAEMSPVIAEVEDVDELLPRA